MKSPVFPSGDLVLVALPEIVTLSPVFYDTAAATAAVVPVLEIVADIAVAVLEIAVAVVAAVPVPEISVAVVVVVVAGSVATSEIV